MIRSVSLTSGRCPTLPQAHHACDVRCFFSPPFRCSSRPPSSASTTSTFGDALTPPAGAPSAWIAEDVVPIPKNIYGTTKVAAEELCRIFHRNHHLSCVVLRTSRFFPEADDVAERRTALEDANLKTTELLYRRVDVADVVSAHRLAPQKAPEAGWQLHHHRDHAMAIPGDSLDAVLRWVSARCETLQ